MSHGPCFPYYCYLNRETKLGQRRLHLKLMSEDPASDYPVFRSTYETLQECCASVELDRSLVPSQMYLYVSGFTAVDDDAYGKPDNRASARQNLGSFSAVWQKCRRRTPDTAVMQ
ncbi:hypothetical protein EDC04DRAFT_2613147 [Pisolithus marmoratus]|nr:hypothetical protein EDC04DRAFT_2613147 [Pisolithus marmoratus]